MKAIQSVSNQPRIKAVCAGLFMASAARLVADRRVANGRVPPRPNAPTNSSWNFAAGLVSSDGYESEAAQQGYAADPVDHLCSRFALE